MLENVTYNGRSFYPFDGSEDRYVTLGDYCFGGCFFGHPDFSDSYKSGRWYKQLHRVVPTGDYLEDLFAIASSQLDYHEGNSIKQMDGTCRGNGDYAEYNYWWNEPGSKWCGEYVGWCIAMAGIPYETVHPKYTTMGADGKKRSFAWADTAYAGGGKAYELKKGDIILFKYDGGNHVILVESVSTDGDIVTIGSLNGNHSNNVSKHTFTVNAATGKTENAWKSINGYVDTIYSFDFSILDGLTYHKVGFDMQGGSASWSEKKVTNGASYGLMPLPSRSGYTFDGWYTAPEGGKKISSYRIVRLDGDRILYAHWSKASGKTKEEDDIDLTGWRFDADAAAITSIPYDWTGGTIPSKIDGVKVKTIGRYACSSRKKLTSLVIPEGIENIEDGAFIRCTALESVVIPRSLKTMGDYAFANDHSLEEATFRGDKRRIKYGRGTFNMTPFLRADFSAPYKGSIWYKRLNEVKPSGDYITDTVNIAASQDGYHEGNSYDEMDGSNSKGNKDYAEMAYFTCSPAYKWWPYEQSYNYGGWCGNYCNWCMAMASVPEEMHGWWAMGDKDDPYPVWEDTVYASGTGSYFLKAGDILHFNIGHYCIVSEVRNEGDRIIVGTWNGNNDNDVGFDYNELRASDGYNLTMAEEYNRAGSSRDYGERYGVKEIIPALPENISRVEFHNVTFDPNGGVIDEDRTVKKLAYSACYGLMPIPVRDGYTFAGWYTDRFGGKKMTPYRKTLLTEDITLYAHWTDFTNDAALARGAKVSVLPGRTTLLVGSVSDPLQLIVSGADPSAYPLAWTSDNPQIASVDGSGRVTGLSRGSTAVRAYIGGRTLACSVRVTDSTAFLNPRRISYGSDIYIDPLKTYSPGYKTGDGSAFNTRNAVWGYSEDPDAAVEDIEDMEPVINRGRISAYKNDVVEVDASNGRLKAVGEGSVTIFGFDRLKGNVTKLTVHVTALPSASELYMLSGKTASLRFAGVRSDKAEWTIEDVGEDKGCFELESRNGKYTGRIKALAGRSGKAQVTCKYMGFIYKTLVCACDPVFDEDEDIKLIRGNNYALNLKTGSRYNLNPVNTYGIPAWRSGNSSVVFVDGSGTLYARKKGRTSVTCNVSGKSLRINITVE